MIKYKIKTAFKCLTNEKNTIKAFFKLVCTAIGSISSLFAFSVLIKDLSGYNGMELLFQKYWYMLILSGVIASLIINREKISFSSFKEDDDLEIAIKVNNLFSVSATSYVIPTNSYFRTKMDDEYISTNSVQGAFQARFFKNQLQELDRIIADNLIEQGIAGIPCRDRFGEVKKYPLGTVAKVNHNNKHYYFVAINDVNENGKPINQDYQNVIAAFNGLFEAIKRQGHCDDLAIPLIGTGKAAIRSATINKVVRDTIDRFVEADDKITRKLIICISPKDYSDGKVDIKKIEKYLEYRCEFGKK